MSQYKERRNRYNSEQGRQYGGRGWSGNRGDRSLSSGRQSGDDFRDKHQNEHRRRSPAADAQRSHVRPYDERRFPETRYDNGFAFGRSDADAKGQRFDFAGPPRYMSPEPGKVSPYADQGNSAGAQRVESNMYLDDVKKIISIQMEINQPIGMFYPSNDLQKEFWD